ncbi:ribosome assembly factor SBDS [Candidatus Pacearchaeota archaeon]|nr:ribosome assembly factor SBDS [Candidatus Pacearchaeota archaeon]
MVDTIARLRVGKMTFETMVDLNAAMKFRKGEGDISEAIRDNEIWTDIKKGMRPAQDEIENAFGTSQLSEITAKIIKRGELEVTQEYRDEALGAKKKQVIDFLAKNAVDARTGRPYTPDLIESAIKEAGIRIDNQAIEKQMGSITESLKKVIPIKIETKKIKIIIPAQHTGRGYGLLQEYKEKETWNGDGSLEVILNIPVGIQVDFYDKLNSITHGSAITQEIKSVE